MTIKVKQAEKLNGNAQGDEQNNNDKESFTVVSYKKKGSTVHATVSSVSTRAATKQNNAAPLTLANFNSFHHHAFPILNQIAMKNEFQDDKFILKWRKITTMDTCNITATRSFRIIAKALGIGASDLNGYHSFIETCPTISKNVFIMDSDTAKTGFLYSFLNDQNDNKSEDLTVETC